MVVKCRWYSIRKAQFRDFVFSCLRHLLSIFSNGWNDVSAIGIVMETLWSNSQLDDQLCVRKGPWFKITVFASRLYSFVYHPHCIGLLCIISYSLVHVHPLPSLATGSRVDRISLWEQTLQVSVQGRSLPVLLFPFLCCRPRCPLLCTWWLLHQGKSHPWDWCVPYRLFECILRVLREWRQIPTVLHGLIQNQICVLSEAPSGSPLPWEM